MKEEERLNFPVTLTTESYYLAHRLVRGRILNSQVSTPQSKSLATPGNMCLLSPA